MAAFSRRRLGGGLDTFRSDVYLQRARGAGRLFNNQSREFDNPGSDIRGAGVGSIFSNIVSTVLPVLKNVVKGAINMGSKAMRSPVGKKLGKEIKKTITKGAINAVSDVIAGDSPIQAAKRQIDIAKKRVGEKLPEILSPTKAKKPKVTHRNKPKKKGLSVKAKKGGGSKKKPKNKSSKSGKKNKKGKSKSKGKCKPKKKGKAKGKSKKGGSAFKKNKSPPKAKADTYKRPRDRFD